MTSLWDQILTDQLECWGYHFAIVPFHAGAGYGDNILAQFQPSHGSSQSTPATALKIERLVRALYAEEPLPAICLRARYCARGPKRERSGDANRLWKYDRLDRGLPIPREFSLRSFYLYVSTGRDSIGREIQHEVCVP